MIASIKKLWEREWVRVAGIFLFFFFLIFSRKPSLLIHPYPWHEDTRVFLSGVLDRGFLSVFDMFSGYYLVLLRFIVWLAVWIGDTFHLGIYPYAYISNFSAVAISSICLAAICRDRFSWLAPFWWRVGLCVAIIFIPPTYEATMYLMLAHFWIGYWLIMRLVDSCAKLEMPSWLDVLIFLIAIFSTPMGILAGPTYLVIYIYKYRLKINKELMKLLPLLFSSAWILRAVFTGRKVMVSNYLQGDSLYEAFILCINYMCMVVLNPFINQYSLIKGNVSVQLSLFTLIILFLTCIAVKYLNKNKMTLIYMSIFFFISAGISFGGSTMFIIAIVNAGIYHSVQVRLLFIPTALFISIIFFVFSNLFVHESSSNKFPVLKITAYLLLLTLAFNSCINYDKIMSENTVWWDNVALYDKKGGQLITVSASPLALKGARMHNFPTNFGDARYIARRIEPYEWGFENATIDVQLATDKLEEMSGMSQYEYKVNFERKKGEESKVVSAPIEIGEDIIFVTAIISSNYSPNQEFGLDVDGDLKIDIPYEFKNHQNVYYRWAVDLSKYSGRQIRIIGIDQNGVEGAFISFAQPVLMSKNVVAEAYKAENILEIRWNESEGFEKNGMYTGYVEQIPEAFEDKVYGSWITGDDNIGSMISRPIKIEAPGYLSMFAFHENFSDKPSLELGIDTDSDGIIDVPYQFEGGSRGWNLFQVDLSPHVGKDVSIIARDNDKDMGGWFAFLEPVVTAN